MDTTKRVSDYMIDLRSKEVRDVKILIPEKMEVSSLPAPYQIHTAWVDFVALILKQAIRLLCIRSV